MNTLHLYRISYNDLGNTTKFVPAVPKYRASDEESVTKRVCASTTIVQCLQSKTSYLNEDIWHGAPKMIYVYEADIPIQSVIQPSIQEVQDTWITGEFWVLDTFTWKKTGDYELTLGEKIQDCNCTYRYYFKPVNQECPDLYDNSQFAIDGEADHFYFTEAGPVTDGDT